MSINPTLLRAMQAAGCTTDQILAVVEAEDALEEARKEAKRANNAERQRRFKAARKAESNADNALPALDDVTAVTSPLDKKSPQTPKELIPREIGLIPARDLDLPEGVSPELWDQYRAMRKRIKKPLNANAEQLALKKLRQFAEDGKPPGQAVEDAIVGSYQGLFEPKATKNGRSSSNIPDHEWGRTGEAAESVIADIRAARALRGEAEASAGH